jgi:hypothetical protein
MLLQFILALLSIAFGLIAIAASAVVMIEEQRPWSARPPLCTWAHVTAAALPWAAFTLLFFVSL